MESYDYLEVRYNGHASCSANRVAVGKRVRRAPQHISVDCVVVVPRKRRVSSTARVASRAGRVFGTGLVGSAVDHPRCPPVVLEHLCDGGLWVHVPVRATSAPPSWLLVLAGAEWSNNIPVLVFCLCEQNLLLWETYSWSTSAGSATSTSGTACVSGVLRRSGNRMLAMPPRHGSSTRAWSESEANANRDPAIHVLLSSFSLGKSSWMKARRPCRATIAPTDSTRGIPGVVGPFFSTKSPFPGRTVP